MAWGNSELLRFKIKKIRFFFITWKYQLNLISSILNLSSKKYPTIIPTLLLYFLSTSNIYLSGSADCSYRGVPSPVPSLEKKGGEPVCGSLNGMVRIPIGRNNKLPNIARNRNKV